MKLNIELRRLVGVCPLVPFLLVSACSVETLPPCEGEECEALGYAELPAIYGTDNRVEVASATSRQKSWAESVGHLVPTASVTCAGANCDVELTEPMSAHRNVDVNGVAYPMCADEAFSSQMRAGYCSAFLIGPDLLATAGHCFDDDGTPGVTTLEEARAACEQTNVVFGYDASTVDRTNRRARIPSRDNYFCSTVVSVAFRDDEVLGGAFRTRDWAVFKLDRPVEGRAALPIRRDGEVGRREALTVIGFPLGLPLKVAAGGTVRAPSLTLGPSQSSWFFEHNADTQGGNSGSPVINSGTGVVEGIHVRSPGTAVVDSKKSPACARWLKCPETGCVNSPTRLEWGEASRTALLRHVVPSLAPRKFEEKAAAVAATYKPFTGDFDGDGESDVYWFGPLTAADAVSWGTTSRSFVAGSDTTSQDYKPLTGDFDRDGATDIFWYGPGTIQDRMSWGTSARTFGSSTLTNTSGKSLPNTSSATYQPLVGDFDGDGFSDVFWHAPGAGVDLQWYGRADRKFDQKDVQVAGTYTRRLVGDFDGDGRSDIFWYLQGGTSYVTFGSAARSSAATRALTVKSTGVPSAAFTPFVGDFDGDGRSDIYFYAPGAVADVQWFGRTDKRFDTTSDVTTLDYRPIVGDFDGDARDDIFWYGLNAQVDKISWGAAGRNFPTVSAPSVSSDYLPLVGDFDGNSASDIYFYKSSHIAERIFYGLVKS